MKQDTNSLPLGATIRKLDCIGVHRSSKKSTSHHKILDGGRVTWSKFLIEGPKILGANVQNLVTWAKWRLGFLHSCIYIYPHSMTAIYTKYIHRKHYDPNLPTLSCYFMTKFRLLLWPSRLSHRRVWYMDINVQGNVLPPLQGRTYDGYVSSKSTV